MDILNLGCGTKVSSSPEVINIDWSVYLRLRRNRVLRAVVPLVVKGERLHHFKGLSDNIMVHNLAKGLPFPSNSIDVVYHSHFLEHLDRDVARVFLVEVKRVLKSGGIQRIVVPDFEQACRAYIAHIAISEIDSEEASKHDQYVAAIIEQSVRRNGFGTSQQKPVRRFLENTFLGDARQRGETHQWMYDRVNLSELLLSIGYKSIVFQSYETSVVPQWNSYGLDLDEHGGEYKRKSLYIEARK
jgi:SAM-dependent methyltransferase